jgi:hypothetical protein
MVTSILPRTRARAVAILAVAILLAFVPSAHAAGCSYSFGKPFLPWNDDASYALAPGGSLESTSGWSLSGGAKLVSGNEPFYVHNARDSHSLSLPTGSSATSSFMCVATNYPMARLFARNAGSRLSLLSVEVLVKGPLGIVVALPLGTQTLVQGWKPTSKVLLLQGQLISLVNGTASIAFRFKPIDGLGKWQIDDLYVDPRLRG